MPESPCNPTPAPTPPKPNYVRQLALQGAAAFGVLSLAWPYFGLTGETLPWPATAWAIGLVALALASFTRQPWWWKVIHLLFAPAAWLTSLQPIHPGWFLLSFFILLLTYRGALSGQIPLFLSNRETAAKLGEICTSRNCPRFIDLGAGIASTLLPLAKRQPQMVVTGCENAPITWVVGFLRTLGRENCVWQWGDLWRVNLAEFDVIYVFLSPAPMAALWEKAQREMRPGSLFISNSFPIPDVEATDIVDISDRRQTRLYCYSR